MERTHKVYIIAEVGVNHNGDLALAFALIDAAIEAGADAVKFQTFRTENLATKVVPKAQYQTTTTDAAESQYQMLKKLELSTEDHVALQNYCREKGIDFLSTPFDEESLDFLVGELNVERLKMSSGDITNAPLLLKAAQSGKPIILSTGMSTLGEIEEALGVLAYGYCHATPQARPSLADFEQARCSEAGRAFLGEKVVLLHCTSEYPAPFSEVNLNVMKTLKTAFGLPVGLSDHTEGIAVPISAAALGAVIIEKHFTLDRDLPGPDHKASLEPDALIAMVAGIRQVEQALGLSLKMPTASEQKNRSIARKYLVASQNIKKGETFTPENITVKRSGEGMSPFRYWGVLGEIAPKDFEPDDKVIL